MCVTINEFLQSTEVNVSSHWRGFILEQIQDVHDLLPIVVEHFDKGCFDRKFIHDSIPDLILFLVFLITVFGFMYTLLYEYTEY